MAAWSASAVFGWISSRTILSRIPMGSGSALFTVKDKSEQLALFLSSTWHRIDQKLSSKVIYTFDGVVRSNGGTHIGSVKYTTKADRLYQQ